MFFFCLFVLLKKKKKAKATRICRDSRDLMRQKRGFPGAMKERVCLPAMADHPAGKPWQRAVE